MNSKTDDPGSGDMPEVLTLSEIREIVDRDKALAVDVIREAGDAIATIRGYQLGPADITGKPDGLDQFNRYKREQHRNLQAVKQSPFFARFSAEMTGRSGVEKIDVLVSDARDVGGAVLGEGWLLTNWTSPLGIAIRGAGAGESFTLEVRWETTYDVESTAQYEELLPKVVNGQFEVKGPHVGVISSEDELAELEEEKTVATELPAKQYEAAGAFGLNDIVVLVDKPQQAALGLPFAQSVAIDGPPGSGKTSVGIMRIAVLYDQQWEKLGLDRKTDRPFHDDNSMRILVYNEEMVEYLRNLALSINVSHVQVMTTKDFFKQICRATRMLSGTERRDRPSLAIMKSRRESLAAYFAGFKSHASAYWSHHEGDLRSKFFNLAPDFLALADRLSGWVDRIGKATFDDGRIEGQIGIADGLTQAIDSITSGRSATRQYASAGKDQPDKPTGGAAISIDLLRERLPEVKKIVEAAVRGICSRPGITKAMFEQPQYESLKKTLSEEGISDRIIEDGDRLWRRQYAGDLPAYSEMDLAMSAWLGARLLMSINAQSAPWIGGRPARLTHLVVDEAQDLSPSHLTVLSSQLSPQGTMTLVGDIHQNLNPHAGLKSWEDTGIANIMLTAFGINHRQTLQLGSFVAGLYTGLFDKECNWQPAKKLVGEKPRVGVARSWPEIADAVAAEAQYWRDAIAGVNGATVAVLYDGKMEVKRLKWLQNQLKVALGDELVTVEAAMPGSGGEAIRRTDRVVIASVRQTKGLEFDAVIFIEPRPRWSKPEGEIDLRWRNGFYVATSRARAGLSVCMSNLPKCLGSLAEQGLCENVEWSD